MAAAPAVDILAGGDPVVEGLENPDEASLDLDAGTVEAAVAAAGTTDPVIGPADVAVEDGILTIAYAWGSLEDDNLKLATQTITGLHSGPGGVHAGEAGLAASGALPGRPGGSGPRTGAALLVRRSASPAASRAKADQDSSSRDDQPDTSRSGRPLGAAGPLVSRLVGLLTAVGLGCAAVGVAPSSAADATALRRTRLSRPTGRLGCRPRPASGGDAAARDRRRSRRPSPRRRGAGARRARGRRGPPIPPERHEAAQPVRLRIADVDIDVEVRPTGVAKDGSMELPDTVRRAGWYRFGATRATTGTTVIAAHVDTRSEGLGPFARLTSVRRGDRIVVTDRGGDEHTYRVVSRRQVDRTRLPVDDLFDRDGPPRLVLLTCGGAYDARSGYRDNVVVMAEPDR